MDLAVKGETEKGRLFDEEGVSETWSEIVVAVE
jgi:hypothetical protein